MFLNFLHKLFLVGAEYQNVDNSLSEIVQGAEAKLCDVKRIIQTLLNYNLKLVPDTNLDNFADSKQERVLITPNNLINEHGLSGVSDNRMNLLNEAPVQNNKRVLKDEELVWLLPGFLVIANFAAQLGVVAKQRV